MDKLYFHTINKLTNLKAIVWIMKKYNEYLPINNNGCCLIFIYNIKSLNEIQNTTPIIVIIGTTP